MQAYPSADPAVWMLDGSRFALSVGLQAYIENKYVTYIALFYFIRKTRSLFIQWWPRFHSHFNNFLYLVIKNVKCSV